MQTQRALGDVFSELSQKNPELREEFTYNSETQRILCKNGETLLGEFNASASVVSYCNIFLSCHPVYFIFVSASQKYSYSGYVLVMSS